MTHKDEHAVVWSAIEKAKESWGAVNEEEKEEHQMAIDNCSAAGMILVDDGHTLTKRSR